jgi:DNA-binding winged helix-turn-helix (wHTH) protein
VSQSGRRLPSTLRRCAEPFDELRTAPVEARPSRGSGHIWGNVLTKPFSFLLQTRENAAVKQSASVADIQVSLLGGFSIKMGGQPVEDHWRLRKAKTLVKLLALAPGHWLHRDVIIENLWPDAPPEAASNNLHQILHSVRHMIGPDSIALHDDVVRLGPSGGLIVDVELFEQAAAAARRSSDVGAYKTRPPPAEIGERVDYDPMEALVERTRGGDGFQEGEGGFWIALLGQLGAKQDH